MNSWKMWIAECCCFHGTLSLKSSSFYDNSRGLGIVRASNENCLPHPRPPLWYISIQNISPFTPKKNSLHNKGQAGPKTSILKYAGFGPLENYCVFFLRFYYFIFRGEGREKEGEKHQCVVASCMPPTGDPARKPGMHPNRGPLVHRPAPNSLSHTSQWYSVYFYLHPMSCTPVKA